MKRPINELIAAKRRWHYEPSPEAKSQGFKGWYSRGYIENNPIKAGLVKAARDWEWSSARYRGEYGADEAPRIPGKSNEAVRNPDGSGGRPRPPVGPPLATPDWTFRADKSKVPFGQAPPTKQGGASPAKEPRTSPSAS